MSSGKSATEQLVVELVGRTEKLEAAVAHAKQELADLGRSGAKATVDTAAGATIVGDRFGKSSRQIAMATEQMARLGTVGGESVKQIISQGAEMVTFFGPTGAWVGALGIAGVALIEMLDRGEKKLDQLRRKFDETLAQMVKSGDIKGLADQATEMYSGAGPFATRRDDENAAAFGIRKSGLAVARQLVQQLTADLEVAYRTRKKALEDDPNTLKKSTVEASANVGKLEVKLNDLTAALVEVDREYNRTMLGFNEATKKVASEAGVSLSRMQEEAAQATAKLNLELQQSALDLENADRKAKELARTAGVALKVGIEQALGALTGGLSEAALRAIDEQAIALQAQVALNESLTLEEKERLTQAIRLTRELQRERERTKPLLDEAGLTVSAVGGAGHTPTADLTALMGIQMKLTEEKRRIVALGGDAHEIDVRLLAIDKARAEILKQLLGTTKDVTTTQEYQLRKTIEQAQAIQQAVDGALQLANAFGLVDNQSTGILRSVGQIAGQLPAMVAQIEALRSGAKGADGKPLGSIGAVVGAALPVVGALAALTTSIISLTGSTEQNREQMRQLSESLNSTFASLADPLYTSPGYGGDSLANQEARLRDQFREAREQVERDLAGSSFEIGRNQRLYDLNELEKKRIELLRQEYAEESERIQRSAEARRLRALGFDAEATAIERAIANQRELKDVVDETTRAIILAAQAAEAEAAAAKAAHDAAVKAVQESQAWIDQANEMFGVTNAGEIFSSKAQAYGKTIGGTLGELLASFDLQDADPENIAAIDDALKEFFKQLKENPDAVDLAGLSIDELIQVLLDLHGAAGDVADGVADAVDQINEALSELSLEEQIFGTSPTEHAQKTAGAYGIDLSGFDLGTPAGVAAAKSYLQGLFRENPALGQAIASIIAALNAIPFAANGAAVPRGGGATGDPNLSVTQEIRTITVEQGGRMLSTMTAILATLTDIKALFVAAASTIITPPQLSVGLLAGSGSATITLTFYQSFYGPVGQVDRSAAASFANDVYDELSRRLGADVRSAVLLKGNTIQS